MKKNILLVESIAPAQNPIRAWLMDDARQCFDVHCAPTLKQGLQHLETHSPDLIFLDLFLPDAKGLRAYLSVNAEAAGIPIVVLAPSGQEPLARAAVSRGAQDGLVKEKLNPAAIRRVVEDALQRHQHLERHRRANALLLQRTVPDTDGPEPAASLRRFQAIMQKQTRLFFQILGSMGEGLILLDHSHRVVLSNPAAKRIFGPLPCAVLNENWFARNGLYLNPQKQTCSRYDFPLFSALHGKSRKNYEVYIRNAQVPQGAYYSVTATPIWDRDGFVQTALLVFTDINEQRIADEKLKALNASLERRVQERTQEALKATDALADLNRGLEDRIKERTRALEKEIQERQRAENQIQQSLDQKVVLLQEVHHRVKNNLQIISSLLRMQEGKTRNAEAIQILKDSRHRIQSIALGHQLLYQSRDIAHIQLEQYIVNLVDALKASYDVPDDKIRFHTAIQPLPMPLNTAVPCGMILTELISNIIRHAFPGNRPGDVYIEFNIREDQHCLTVRDNGAGLPAGFNPAQSSSLGLRIIHSLAQQLNGQFSLEIRDGTTATLCF